MSLAIVLGARGEVVVKVVYSDESGTDGDEKRNPSTLVSALLFNMDSQWKPMRDAIEKAILETVQPEDISRYALKGKRIYHQIERGENIAKELMMRLMRIPRQCLTPVFYAAIHRVGFRAISHHADASFTPFQLAFQNCMLKIDTYVHTSYRNEEVLWIHDAGNLNGVTKESLRSWRRWLVQLPYEYMIEQEKRNNPPMSHVADMIYFGDDKESRLLQLVDCCCCTIARHLRGDPIVAPYYELIGSQIVGEGERPSYENANQ